MALSAVAQPARRNSGLGAEILRSMRAVAASKGFESLIAPVRPNRKESYPLAKFEEYISWTHPDGTAFDPWLRVHLQLGGRVLTIAPEPMAGEGTVEQWTHRSGRSFPPRRPPGVPGAPAPVLPDP